MGANEKHAATYHGGEYTHTRAQIGQALECAYIESSELEEVIDNVLVMLSKVRAEAKAEAWDEAVKWYVEKIACPRTCGDCAYCREDDTYNPYKEES
ncbi:MULTISPECIES: hypothetical protein [Actinomycetes]|uniref:hypothetical protein n=1 Tax=Actinomycetes TaxID=1760 RepID=UPI00341716CA